MRPCTIARRSMAGEGESANNTTKPRSTPPGSGEGAAGGVGQEPVPVAPRPTPPRSENEAKESQQAGSSPSCTRVATQNAARGAQSDAGGAPDTDDAFLLDFGDVDCPQTMGAAYQAEDSDFDPLGDLCTLPEFAKHIPKQYRTSSGLMSVFQLRQRHIFQATDDKAELNKRQAMYRALELLLEQKRSTDERVPESQRAHDLEYQNVVDLCHWASVTQASVFTSTTHSSTDMSDVFAERLRLRHMHPCSTLRNPAPSNKGSITVQARDEYDFLSPGSARSLSRAAGGTFMSPGSSLMMSPSHPMAQMDEEENEEEEDEQEQEQEQKAESDAVSGPGEPGETGQASAADTSGGDEEEWRIEAGGDAPEAEEAESEQAGPPLSPSGAEKDGRDAIAEADDGSDDPELGFARERRPTILIVVTVYNEDASELRSTLEGIANNVDEFVRQSEMPAEAAGGCCGATAKRKVTWRDIAVVIVSDGIIGGADIGQGRKGRVIPSPSFRAELKRMGLWHSALIKRAMPRKDDDGKPVEDGREQEKDPTAIIFERTVLLPKSESEFHEPMQLIYAGKVNNGGKLSSHDLFFNGFCRIAKPDYVFLVDVGTIPEPKSIVRLHTAMEGDENVGGCCGDITVSMLNACAYVSPLLAAQVFEYKTANYINKATESFMGFISVLPGAFSAYRWEAIDGVPLSKYFLELDGEKRDQLGAFERNMYLAEDRILCTELVVKHRHRYVLRYVKNAPAKTDVPDTLPKLLNQRRRWSNGAMFATLYAIENFTRIWLDTKHSFTRKLALTVQFTYNVVALVFGFLGIGIYYALLRAFINSFFDSFGKTSIVILGDAMQFAFLTVCALQLLYAIRIKPQHAESVHTLCSTFFGVYALMVMGLGLRAIFFSGELPIITQVLTVALLSSFEFMAVLHQDPFSVLASMPSYFFFSGVYILMVPIFANSNTQDVSWGTRESGSSDEDQKRQLSFNKFSVSFLTFWIMANVLIVGAANLDYIPPVAVIEALVYTGSGMMVYNLTFALAYIVQHHVRKRICGKR